MDIPFYVSYEEPHFYSWNDETGDVGEGISIDEAVNLVSSEFLLSEEESTRLKNMILDGLNEILSSFSEDDDEALETINDDLYWMVLDQIEYVINTPQAIRRRVKLV